MTRRIDKIIIHCLDTYHDQDVGVTDVRRWHVEERGWSDIGYHYLIRQSGAYELGRDLDNDGDVDEEVGAHAFGYNGNSIGIALAGGKARDGGQAFNFRYEQLLQLVHLVKFLKTRYPDAEVIGHNEVSNKDCPMFDVRALFANIYPQMAGEQQ